MRKVINELDSDLRNKNIILILCMLFIANIYYLKQFLLSLQEIKQSS
jgi:hypothetical protein